MKKGLIFGGICILLCIGTFVGLTVRHTHTEAQGQIKVNHRAVEAVDALYVSNKRSMPEDFTSLVNDAIQIKKAKEAVGKVYKGGKVVKVVSHGDYNSALKAVDAIQNAEIKSGLQKDLSKVLTVIKANELKAKKAAEAKAKITAEKAKKAAEAKKTLQQARVQSTSVPVKISDTSLNNGSSGSSISASSDSTSYHPSSSSSSSSSNRSSYTPPLTHKSSSSSSSRSTSHVVSQPKTTTHSSGGSSSKSSSISSIKSSYTPSSQKNSGSYNISNAKQTGSGVIDYGGLKKHEEGANTYKTGTFTISNGN